MRTTIDLPDELFREAKARAALDGMKLKDLITRFVADGLSQQGRQRRRSALPSVPPRGRTIQAPSNAELTRLMEEEEAGGRGR